MAPSPSVPSAVRLLVLTDRAQAAAAGHALVDVVAAAVSGPPVAAGRVARGTSGARSVAEQRIAHPESRAGATAVVLREKDLPPAERVTLARRLRDVTADAGVTLLVAGDPALAAAVGADGTHLAAVDRWPAARGGLVGRSCHTVGEVWAAVAEGADYVTYSPVFATASKPGYGPAVGLDGLRAARRAADEAGGATAVVALGGIGRGRAQACLRAGADGVAVMGEIMRADDPGAVVRALAAEVSEAWTAGGARG